MASLSALTRRAGRASHPDAALPAIAELREELEVLERHHVATAIVEGWSWSRVASCLGVSKQAAHKKHARTIHALGFDEPEAAAGGTVVVTAQAREAVRLAREEAADAGAALVATEHLLLGILRSSAGSRAGCDAPTSIARLAWTRIERLGSPDLLQHACVGARSTSTVERGGCVVSGGARRICAAAIVSATALLAVATTPARAIELGPLIEDAAKALPRVRPPEFRPPAVTLKGLGEAEYGLTDTAVISQLDDAKRSEVNAVDSAVSDVGAEAGSSELEDTL